MKEILLTQGKVALVDSEDFDWLNQWKWCVRKHRRTFYAQRGIWQDGKVKILKMHHLLLDTPLGKQMDHCNGDGLDNRKTNLRVCTQNQNQWNRRKQRGTTSKYKGVSWYAQTGKWEAQIKQNGEKFFLGYFANESDAAIAYNNAALERFGEFAKLNPIWG